MVWLGLRVGYKTICGQQKLLQFRRTDHRRKSPKKIAKYVFEAGK